MAGKKEAAPHQGTAPTSNIRKDQSTVPGRVVARCLAAPPCCTRRMWAISVPKCPHCGGAHQHRAVNTAELLGGNAKRTCPCVGRTYRLRVVRYGP